MPEGFGLKAGNIVAGYVEEPDITTPQPGHARQGQPINAIRHDNISQQQVDRLIAFQEFQREPEVRGRLYLVAHSLEQRPERKARCLIVVNYQNRKLP